MRFLSCCVGDEPFAILFKDIEEVIPSIPPLKDKTSLEAGWELHQIHGKFWRILDLKKLLFSTSCRNSFDTRIVLLDFEKPESYPFSVGVKLEKVNNEKNTEVPLQEHPFVFPLNQIANKAFSLKTAVIPVLNPKLLMEYYFVPQNFEKSLNG